MNRSRTRIACSQFLSGDDLRVDDLDAVAHGNRLFLAWSCSSLEQQDVALAEIGSSDDITMLGRVPGGFRPSLALLDDTPVVSCCLWTGDRFAPALWLHRSRESFPRLLPHDGQVHRVRLVAAPQGVWIAWTERDGRRSWISVVHVDVEGRLQEVARLEGREPALAPGALAWIDETGLCCADLGETGLGVPQRVAPGNNLEAPVLGHHSSRSRFLAWHAPAGDGVLQWYHLARRQNQRWEGIDIPVSDEGTSARGEDQGWEFPALLIDHRQSVWLAGRSSHGFHVQALTTDGWTPRTSISEQGWSGRSRTCALVEHQGQVLLIRGTPRGLRINALSLEPLGAEQPDAVLPLQPAVPRSSRPSSRPSSWPGVLFGDLHQHTIHSDGLGSVEMAYRRARDQYGHDFAAVTDHEKLGPQHLGPVTWRYQCQIADAFDDPGRFVTLRAYEFTGARLPGPGHKCVYFAERIPDHLPPKEVEPLGAMLRELAAIAVPHHVGWTGADLEHHDPALQPVWEICSVHGAYELEGDQLIPPRDDIVLPGQFIRDALDAGLVFGFVGGTDSHGLRWHHGVSRKPDPWATGLTAVFAEPTRESLLAALRERRCYATSGARILLRVDVEGAPMGSEIQRPGAEIQVAVQGNAPVERLSIIQDGDEVFVTAGGPILECRYSFEVTGPSSYLYVRVLQRDGEMAWSSPVWVRG